MEFCQPKNIVSPISGQPVKPLIKEYQKDGVLFREAHYIDPASGTFIRKVLLSQEEIKKDI